MVKEKIRYVKEYKTISEKEYDKKDKKTHYETITRQKGKKKYEVKVGMKDNGDIRKRPAKKLKRISKKDRTHGVTAKWRVDKKTTKKRYKNVDIYETTTIFERQKKMFYQVCAWAWYKEHGRIHKKFVFMPMRAGEPTYKKIKNDYKMLLFKVEQFYEPIRVEPFIRYYDYAGGTDANGKIKQ